MESTNRPMSAAEKKRLRDRQAQQSLRDKRSRIIRKLEEKAAFCGAYHNDYAAQMLLQENHVLRRQIESFMQHEELLRHLAQSWSGIAFAPSQPGPVQWSGPNHGPY
ncbi:hypothetical protein BDV11DRAFT_160104 [Aspergillus similis]